LTINFFRSYGIDIEEQLRAIIPAKVADPQVPSIPLTPPIPNAPQEGQKLKELLKDFAIPTVSKPPRKSDDPDAAFYRPKIIEGGSVKKEQTANLSKPYDKHQQIQLFVHQNGQSNDPFVFHAARDRFCRSMHTIQSQLSRQFPDECETNVGHVCRVFLQNGW